jgi:uncharacterized protein (TIGR03067 family)
MNLAILALTLAVGDGGSSNDAYEFTGADDRAELERGVWQIVGLTVQGKSIPAESLKQEDLRLTFRGEQLAFSRAQGRAETHRFKINPNASPRQLEWTLPLIVGDPKGIYRLENGTLTIALGAWGQNRVKSFSDEGIEMVLILKRVAP